MAAKTKAANAEEIAIVVMIPFDRPRVEAELVGGIIAQAQWIMEEIPRVKLQ